MKCQGPFFSGNNNVMRIKLCKCILILKSVFNKTMCLVSACGYDEIFCLKHFSCSNI